MTVLSKTEIVTLMGKGELIVGGDSKHVRGSSYSCHVAKVIPGGPEANGTEPPIADWTSDPDAKGFRVQPRQIVWVRIRESVKLPESVCAFWWQTNTLSRRGLMLVNMSMVDPGYEGPLACLFVNFGREPVDISPGVTVARLVFHRMEGEADPFTSGTSIEQYDRELAQVALQGPPSFLSLQEFSIAFHKEEEAAFEDFKSKADAFRKIKEGEIENSVKSYFSSTKEEFVKDLPKSIIKSYGVAFGGLVLLLAIIAFVPWAQSKIAPNLDAKIRGTVDKALSARLVTLSGFPPGTSASGALGDVAKRLESLEQELRELKAAQGDKSSKQ